MILRGAFGQRSTVSVMRIESDPSKEEKKSRYILSKVIKDNSWRRQWHPTPVLLPGKSHGQRNLVGCSPWGR